MLAGLLDEMLGEADNTDGRRRLAPVFRQRQYFELEDFHGRFRLNREQVDGLMGRIGPYVEGQTLRTSALSVQNKVLIALRYYASGAIHCVIADANGPSPSSVNRSIKSVTKAINEVLFQETICFPRNMGANGNGHPPSCKNRFRCLAACVL